MASPWVGCLKRPYNFRIVLLSGRHDPKKYNSNIGGASQINLAGRHASLGPTTALHSTDVTAIGQGRFARSLWFFPGARPSCPNTRGGSREQTNLCPAVGTSAGLNVLLPAAARIGVSEGSIKSTLQQLFSKTGVRTRSQLVRIVLEQYRDQIRQISQTKSANAGYQFRSGVVLN